MPRGIYKRKAKSKPVLPKVKAKAKRRKWRVVAETLPVDDIAHEKVREEFSVIDWVNAADSPSERQLRKAAMHGVMYSGGSVNDEGGLLRAASRIRDQMAENVARKEQLAGEGIPHQKWYPGAVLVKPSGHTELHTDTVNHPAHYLQHPSGVECIAITEHFNFNRGNAIKYIWRADEKGSTLENLRKARWYLDREILRLEQKAIK